MEKPMTTGLRWRILILQVGLMGVLGMCAGFLFWGSSTVSGMVHDQLAAEQIYFPPAGSAALSPAEFPDLQQFAGQQLVNGDQARAYANGFIGRHLVKVAGGRTYAQVSTLALAHPRDATLAAQKAALFQGETLRGLLLDSYGWSQLGRYEALVGVALTIAGALVLLTLLYELLVAPRRETESVAKGPGSIPAPVA
jgi:hypothetical protein